VGTFVDTPGASIINNLAFGDRVNEVNTFALCAWVFLERFEGPHNRFLPVGWSLDEPESPQPRAIVRRMALRFNEHCAGAEKKGSDRSVKRNGNL